MSEFEKDFYNRIVHDFKEYEHFFSEDVHDFINSCTMKFTKDIPLSAMDWFNLGIRYAKIQNHKVDNKID